MRFEHLAFSRTNTPDDLAALDAAIIDAFHPPVRTWWRARFSRLSLPQQLAIPAIAQGKNTLVCAPTGTGKTLCAFISILSDLFARRAAGVLEETIDTLYISPLKALGTDITKTLLAPLSEIESADGQISEPVKERLPLANSTRRAIADAYVIRVAQRTGDTSPKDRAAMVRHPPHILITTPESLALCLASASMRDHLRRVRRIIIDELHSVVPNKRGTDLMLSVERLSHLVTSGGSPDPQRIGLSATIAPLERMAEFLVGTCIETPTERIDESAKEKSIAGSPIRPLAVSQSPRTCAIADASFHRPLELTIASTFGKTPFSTTAAINRQVYDILEKTIRAHRTTLVFTNLRAATERITFALRKRFAGAAADTAAGIIAPAHIEAHHSSLDRDIRLDIERRLKAGELRCVVCSTSLELGIDIGTIDRVILLNSPKGVARGLQRVGRSGHSLDATAVGTFIPTVPADLLEALVTADAMRKRQVDAIDYPRNCLDVLAQHLLGMALQSQPHGIPTDEAFCLIRRAAPYAALSREQFDAVVRYVATSELHESTNVHAKLWLEEIELADQRTGEPVSNSADSQPHSFTDATHGTLHPLRKSLSGLYAQNVGTITQEGQVKVRIEDGGQIGAIEEAFAQILKPGDRFVLGGRCVQFIRSRGMSIDVAESAGQTPTVPRWHSGTMAMEPGLAVRMREFRAKARAIAPAGEAAIARMLTRQFSAAEETARVAAAYLHAQFRYADIPIDGNLLVERVPDENPGGSEATVLIFHTMAGRAANEALARAIAYRLHQRFHLRPFDTTRHPLHGNRDAGIGGATVVIDDYAFGVWIEASTAAKRADRTLIRSLLSPHHFEADLAAAVETSDLFRAQFRFTAIRAHALLQNKFGRRRFIGQMQSYATRLYESLKEFHPDHLLLRETRRTVMEDLLCAPAARHFLEAQSSQGLRLIDLPAPSPFAFGLFATGKRDTLQLADTADFLLAMYEQVQRRLKTVENPEPQATLFS